MNSEFWVDGFNFFHHWDNTKGFLRSDSGLDVVKAMERSIRTLGRQLGGKCGQTVVYMDGGLSRHHANVGPLRIRYAGPGKKADDRMAADLEELGASARLVTGVTNDRELKGRLRLLGANCLGIGEFLSLLEGKRKKGAPKPGARLKGGKTAPSSTAVDAEVLREKTRSLSPSEVNAWLEFFGGDMEVWRVIPADGAETKASVSPRYVPNSRPARHSGGRACISGRDGRFGRNSRGLIGHGAKLSPRVYPRLSKISPKNQKNRDRR